MTREGHDMGHGTWDMGGLFGMVQIKNPAVGRSGGII